MKLICPICEKEITKKDKILAFAEFIPEDYQWEGFDTFGEFDEVIPASDGWNLAHYWCMFKKPREEKNLESYPFGKAMKEAQKIVENVLTEKDT